MGQTPVRCDPIEPVEGLVAPRHHIYLTYLPYLPTLLIYC